jgi:hypothetical protein
MYTSTLCSGRSAAVVTHLVLCIDVYIGRSWACLCVLWCYSFWHEHVAYYVHCRLNPSQTVNQLSAPKSVCCNSASAAPPSKASGNHQLTEYFPVRRSVRKTKTIVLEEQQRDLEEAVLSQREEGLEVVCTQFFYSKIPGQPDWLYNIERKDGSELGGVWSEVAWCGPLLFLFLY